MNRITAYLSLLLLMCTLSCHAVQITLSNFTDYSVLSFRVMTGKKAGKCASSLSPDIRFYAKSGSSKLEIPLDKFKNQICGGRFPCQLNVYLGSGLCTGYKWGSLAVYPSKDQQDLEFSILQTMTPKTPNRQKMKLIGDTNIFSIQPAGLSR